MDGLCRVDHVGFRVPDIDVAEAFFREQLGFVTLYGHGPYFHHAGRWLAEGDVPDVTSGSRHHVGHLAGTRLRLSMLGHRGGPKVELLQLDVPASDGWRSLYREEFGGHFVLICATDLADRTTQADDAIVSPWGLRVHRRPVAPGDAPGIQQITVPVANLARTTRLLAGELGLGGKTDGLEGRRATLRCENCDVRLRTSTTLVAPAVARGAAHLAWYVNDMADAAGALARAGVPVAGLVAATFGPELGQDSTYLHFLLDEQDYEFVSFPHGRVHPRAS